MIKSKVSIRFLINFFILCLFINAVPLLAKASATLSVDPVSGSRVLGEKFSIFVNVDTGGEFINAIGSELIFDKNKLSVISLDTSSSIITNWIEAPSFSNDTGIIKFTGGIISPGYSGKGTLFAINFEGVLDGQAEINFSDSGEVFLNDGLGTNILNEINGGIYTILPLLSPLSVSCSASPSSIIIDQSATFVAIASGGTGSYSYSWSGACVGNSYSCSNSFDVEGIKTAKVIITSGGQSLSANCSLSVDSAHKPIIENNTDNGDKSDAGNTNNLGGTGGTSETVGEILPEHNICSEEKKCVSILGQGKDECQSDDDCQPVIAEIIQVPAQTIEIIEKTTQTIKNIVNTPQGSAITKTISTTGVAVIATSTVLFSPFSLLEMFLIPLRLFGILFTALGLKKRAIPWGIVYDSVTKQPIDPAVVSLKDMEGKNILSSITDINGRFGFLAEPNNYQIIVKKSNYLFPSKKLSGKSEDEFYNNLYFGEKILIKNQGEVLTKNIPLDPVGFDWNQFIKAQNKLTKFYSKTDVALRQIFDLFFAFGLVVSAIAFFSAPYPYNTIIFSVYLILFLLRIFGIKPKKVGYVIDKTTGYPLSFAALKIISKSVYGSDTEIGHKFADKYGRYYCLVPKGKYFVKIEKKNEDGSYSPVYASGLIDASKTGIIKNKFKV